MVIDISTVEALPRQYVASSSRQHSLKSTGLSGATLPEFVGYFPQRPMNLGQP